MENKNGKKLGWQEWKRAGGKEKGNVWSGNEGGTKEKMFALN